jgi:hypothetical protein
MEIHPFFEEPDRPAHKKGRERVIGHSSFKNVKIVGRNHHYPNALLYLCLDTQGKVTLLQSNCAYPRAASQKMREGVYIPYDEKIMSLNKSSFYDDNKYTLSEQDVSPLSKIVSEPVFFFIYNFDNYYHYLYDTLPYLHSFLILKNKIPDLKLLINYPSPHKQEFYRFNTEFLEKLVEKSDWIIHNGDHLYETVYVSTSLTHGGLSDEPPCREIYEIYEQIKEKTVNSRTETPELIYISRRTWINKDTSNIGTNYTTRRKMMNEDRLVDELVQIGFKEVFAENLSTDEKINLFNNAKVVVGSIGGGMSNLLFSKPTTKSVIVVTPHFLDINARFKYCMDNTESSYFYDVHTYYEENTVPMYCRVKITASGNNREKIGEIVDYKRDNDGELFLVNISRNDVAGFNNEVIFQQGWFNINEFEQLDEGLNSPYTIDVDKLLNMVRKII